MVIAMGVGMCYDEMTSRDSANPALEIKSFLPIPPKSEGP